MGQSEVSADKLEWQERRERVLTLRRQGFTHGQIGKAMQPPISDERVRQILKEEYSKHAANKAEMAQELSMVITDRYERVVSRLWREVYPAPRKELQNGQEVEVYPPPDLQAIDRLIKVHGHLMDMYGLREPDKMMISVQTLDMTAMKRATIALKYVPEQSRRAFANEVRKLITSVHPDEAA